MDSFRGNIFSDRRRIQLLLIIQGLGCIFLMVDLDSSLKSHQFKTEDDFIALRKYLTSQYLMFFCCFAALVVALL